MCADNEDQTQDEIELDKSMIEMVCEILTWKMVVYILLQSR